MTQPLKCRECGMEASFADANIADLRRTCGAELTPSNTSKFGTAIGGATHDWKRIPADNADTEDDQ